MADNDSTSSPQFVLPAIHDHPDAWGPSPTALPTQFKDIPYAPFSKSDKIGRIVDWNAESGQLSVGANAHQRGFRANRGSTREAYGAGQGGTFAYFHDEDEASFNLVGGGTGSNRGTGGLMGLNRGARGRGSNLRGTAGRGRGAGGRLERGSGARGGAGRRGGQWGRGGGTWKGDWGDRNSRIRESTVVIGQDWQVLEEIEFSRLAKLRLEVDVDAAEDVSTHGFLYEYDRTYDRINTKNPQPLQILDRSRYHPTASEDPIIQELAAQNKAQVFTTDSVLSLLMCATRSVYPWDIVIIKEGGKLFLDKREGGPFDFLSVNENAADPPAESDKPDSPNTPSALSLEATFINQNFGLQVVKEDPKTAYQFEQPNPFYGPDETEPCASAGLRYRSFDLSLSEEEEMTLIIRTEVDAVLRGPNATNVKEQGGNDEDSFITIRTLNEFDSNSQGSGGAPNWRAKLDTQRGAVVATEMKNNSCKLAKWAVQSILAGADQMKMGYISRANPRDASRHVILGQQWLKPKDFAAQINVNLSNGWGIVRTAIDLAFKAEDGKYLLMKDPNKPVVRLYKVPENAFDLQEDEEDGEEADEDDELDLGT
ncbi:hypothetical protein PGT21_035154 [Puccinia graminis f. sp. tritici]|uniref:Eukaryotic translation initiation factor 3 subunit D n=2 Tax=Puccinia graminis f. sp. tritici TaxID=56615 RepID=E3KIW0_PUCGT|nr:translation initiation factor eIF-3 subunit 7 [Puccinia graminis f. sp. tritici CRL 75-36-700-3]EFP84235.2 translation initiation factor eIF-3 subunit 7 [Puccinia graminis f. sp. tritici CRL 75-36-700-3]KAA1073052.1 hypothetical protein PGTUg99_023639 [Puccinia graminis f. sp. tritici]KAA1084760.1 hypothetical protein PGT21_035154 [Puccinia graminis f. sp. tritici]